MKRNLRGMKQGIDPAIAAQMAGPQGNKAMADVQSVIAQYQGHSEAELMGELHRVIGAERAAGSLDDARIREVANSIAPMLTAEQRKRMEQLLESLGS